MNVLITSCFLLIIGSLPDAAVQGGQDARALLSLKPSGLQVRQIELCEIRLKALSASADFVGHWMYKATVSEEGAVETVVRLDDPVNAARFVELADFERCVVRWRFVRPGTYTLLLWGGTMSDHWSVTVVAGTQSMRVRLPRVLRLPNVF